MVSKLCKDCGEEKTPSGKRPNWVCKPCMREYSKKHYNENKQAYYEKCKEYNEAHPERVKGYRKKFRDKNKGLSNYYSSCRRANLRSATPSWHETKQVQGTYKLAQYLTETYGEEIHVDHIIPLSHDKGLVSGLHCMDNLQLVYAKENLQKNNRLDLEGYNEQYRTRNTR